MIESAVTQSDSRADAISLSASPAECVNLVVRLAAGILSGLLTRSALVIDSMNHSRWRRTQRRFCSDDCKYNYHTRKRVKALLNRVGITDFHRILNLNSETSEYALITKAPKESSRNKIQLSRSFGDRGP